MAIAICHRPRDGSEYRLRGSGMVITHVADAGDGVGCVVYR